MTHFPDRYGEMVINDNTTATTISSQNTYTQVTSGWTSSELDGVAFNVDELIVDKPSNYLVLVSATASPANAVTYSFGVAVNGTVNTDTTMSQNFGGTSQKHISLNGVLTLSGGDTVQLHVQNEDGTNDITVNDANVFVKRLK